jgi:hypothetical protein
MPKTAEENTDKSRRTFILSTGGALTGAWLVANWPAVAAAAEHAAHAAVADEPTAFGFLNAPDAADVEAIAAQILPSGTTPGAREAHVVYFIDRALATFFADRAPAFVTGLAQFQRTFRELHPTVAAFAAAAPEEQVAFLRAADRSEFFENLRTLTIWGTLSSSRYGGNHENAGWKLIGFEDQHVFAPPFGYYDRDYPGFVPARSSGNA